mgnify:CR=1 FL=1
MTEKLSDEAQREAERRWPLWLPTGDYETDQENYDEQSAKWQNAESEEHQRAFVSGAQWQKTRDDETIRKWRYRATAGSSRLRPGEAEKLTRALDSRMKLNSIRALVYGAEGCDIRDIQRILEDGE